MEINYKEKLNDINAFIFDVDGVLTDGSLIVSESGELLRTMNVKDGFAMKFAVDNGYKIGIISGGTNESVRKRLNVYHNTTKPLIKFYDKKNILNSINGDDKIENVSKEIAKILNNA